MTALMRDGALPHLIKALRCLPGVGPKSAQRMAFHLLLRNRDGARALAEALQNADERIGHCDRCRTLSEDSVCPTCVDPNRDTGQLCIVEMPSDVHALDGAGCFRGLYFVLNGRLSPLDGIGPDELGLDDLDRRLAADGVREIIIATNATVEGEATAYYLGQMATRHHIRATRIAYGVPLGGELEYLDGATLSLAFQGRRDI